MKRVWLAGDVCLHPTDTLPGLSFDPRNSEAWSHLAAIKKRELGKTCISLIPSLAFAKKFWQDLPGPWESVLDHLWPSSLSVIWKASEKCPQSLVRDNGTVAFRNPFLESENTWLNQVMEELNCPFPTTSVNSSGEYAAENYQDAVAFLEGHDAVFIPSEFVVPGGKASTLIEILGDASYRILRQGPCSEEQIKEALSQ
mgnify:CR=1 FL=1